MSEVTEVVAGLEAMRQQVGTWNLMPGEAGENPRDHSRQLILQRVAEAIQDAISELSGSPPWGPAPKPPGLP